MTSLGQCLPVSTHRAARGEMGGVSQRRGAAGCYTWRGLPRILVSGWWQDWQTNKAS